MCSSKNFFLLCSAQHCKIAESLFIIIVGYETKNGHGTDYEDSLDDSEPDDDRLLFCTGSSAAGSEMSDNNSSLIIFNDNETSVNENDTNTRTEVPLLLQQIEVPSLILPESSDDLLIQKQYVLSAATVYEVFWQFGDLLLLSPFRFADFWAALANKNNLLLVETHMALLMILMHTF